MKISVIIPTYNSAPSLKECLTALERSTLPAKDFEVIIVDDGSSDNTQEILREFSSSSNLKLITLKQPNKGPGIARNLALEKASGDIIAFTDSDCIVDRDWLAVIQKTISGKSRTLIGGTTYNNDTLIFPWVVAPVGQKQITANMAFDRIKLPQANFDEAFRGFWGEDADFVNRLKRSGVSYEFISELKVFHPANTLGAKKIFRRALTRDNEVLLYMRYGTEVNGAFHPFFRPIIFGHISPAAALFLICLIIALALIALGHLLALLVLAAVFCVAFVSYLYKTLVTNTPNSQTVALSDRVITLFYLLMYVPLFVAARVKGSIKYRYLMV